MRRKAVKQKQKENRKNKHTKGRQTGTGMILRTTKNKNLLRGTTPSIKGEGRRSFGIKERTTEGHAEKASG